MNKSNIGVTIDQDITISSEFQTLVRQRKLSPLINDVLRTTLKINKYEIPSEKADIENELQTLQIKKIMLEQKRDDMIKEAEEKRKKNPYKGFLPAGMG